MTESRLFAYGTLMFPEVRSALIGDALPAEPVRLAGYGRHTVRHPDWLPFPAILAQDGEVVEGLLISALAPAVRDILDRFENVESGLYQKMVVTVDDRAGRPITAAAYVAGDVLTPHLSGPWDPEQFRRDQLADFMGRVFGRSCI